MPIRRNTKSLASHNKSKSGTSHLHKPSIINDKGHDNRTIDDIYTDIIPDVTLLAKTVETGDTSTRRLRKSYYSINQEEKASFDSFAKFVIKEQIIKNEEDKIHKKLYEESGFQFGSVYIKSPIISISLEDRKDSVSVDTLRTQEAMTFRSSQSKADKVLVVVIQFANEQMINAELRHIMAQYVAFPYTQIRNKDIARMCLPLDAHLDIYYPYFRKEVVSYTSRRRVTVSKKSGKLQKGAALTDAEVEAIKDYMYANIPIMFHIASITLSPVEDSPDAINATIELMMMDMEPITKTGNVKFLRNTYAAIDQTAKLANIRLTNKDENRRPKVGSTVLSYEAPKLNVGLDSLSMLRSLVGFRETNKVTIEKINETKVTLVPNYNKWMRIEGPSIPNNNSTGWRSNAVINEIALFPENPPLYSGKSEWINLLSYYKQRLSILRSNKFVPGDTDYYNPLLITLVSYTRKIENNPERSVSDDTKHIASIPFSYNGSVLFPIGNQSINLFKDYNGNLHKLRTLDGDGLYKGPISTVGRLIRRSPYSDGVAELKTDADRLMSLFNTDDILPALVFRNMIVTSFDTKMLIERNSISNDCDNLSNVCIKEKFIRGTISYALDYYYRYPSENTTGDLNQYLCMYGISRNMSGFLNYEYATTLITDEINDSPSLFKAIDNESDNFESLRRSLDIGLGPSDKDPSEISRVSHFWYALSNFWKESTTSRTPLNGPDKVIYAEENEEVSGTSTHNFELLNQDGIESGKFYRWKHGNKKYDVYFVLYLFGNKKFRTLYPIIIEYFFDVPDDGEPHDRIKEKANVYSLLPIYSERNLKEIETYISTHYPMSDTLKNKWEQYKDKYKTNVYKTAQMIPEPNGENKTEVESAIDNFISAYLMQQGVEHGNMLSYSPGEELAGKSLKDVYYGSIKKENGSTSVTFDITRSDIFAGLFRKLFNSNIQIYLISFLKEATSGDGLQEQDESSSLDTSELTLPPINNNPSNMEMAPSFLTTNLAQSKPFIRYYTSLLSEYVHNDKSWLRQHYDYLKPHNSEGVIPYTQMSQFPLFTPYKKGTRDEIILTYRTTRTNEYYRNQLEANIVNVIRTFANTVTYEINKAIRYLFPATPMDYYFALMNCNKPTAAYIKNKKYFNGLCANSSAELKEAMSALFGNVFQVAATEAINLFDAIDRNERNKPSIIVIGNMLNNIKSPIFLLMKSHIPGLPSDYDSAKSIELPGNRVGMSYYNYTFFYLAAKLGMLVTIINDLYDKLSALAKDKNRIIPLTRYLKFFYKNVAEVALGKKPMSSKRYINEASSYFYSTKPTEITNSNVGKWDSRIRADWNLLSNLYQYLKLLQDLTVKIWEKKNSKPISKATPYERKQLIKMLRDEIKENKNSLFPLDDIGLKYGISVNDDLLKQLNRIGRQLVYNLPIMYTPDILKWKQLKITGKDFGSNNAILDSYSIATINNSVPIYMDGHENPYIVNLGGGVKKVMLSIVTDNPNVLEKIAEMAVDYNITMRQHNNLKAVSPLVLNSVHNHTVKNRVPSDSKSRLIIERVMKRIQSTADNISTTAVDTPILINNNVANMVGVYGMVLDNILYNTIEDKTNAFVVKMTFTSVDVKQKDRETPRRRKTTIDDKFLLSDMASFASGLWFRQLDAKRNNSDSGLANIINPMVRGMEGLLADLIFLLSFRSVRKSGETDYIKNIYDAISTFADVDQNTYQGKIEKLFGNIMKVANNEIVKLLLESINETNNAVEREKEKKNKEFKIRRAIVERFYNKIKYSINDVVKIITDDSITGKTITTKEVVDGHEMYMLDRISNDTAKTAYSNMVRNSPGLDKIVEVVKKYVVINASKPDKDKSGFINKGYFYRNDQLFFEVLMRFLRYTVDPKSLYITAQSIIKSIIDEHDIETFMYGFVSSIIIHALPYYLGCLVSLKGAYDGFNKKAIKELNKINKEIRETRRTIEIDNNTVRQQIKKANALSNVINVRKKASEAIQNTLSVIRQINKRYNEETMNIFSGNNIQRDPKDLFLASTLLTREILSLLVGSTQYSHIIRQDLIRYFITKDNFNDVKIDLTYKYGKETLVPYFVAIKPNDKDKGMNGFDENFNKSIKDALKNVRHTDKTGDISVLTLYSYISTFDISKSEQLHRVLFKLISGLKYLTAALSTLMHLPLGLGLSLALIGGVAMGVLFPQPSEIGKINVGGVIRSYGVKYERYLLLTFKMLEAFDRYVTIPYISILLTRGNLLRGGTVSGNSITDIVMKIEEERALNGAGQVRLFSYLTSYNWLLDVLERPFYDSIVFDKYNAYPDRPLPVLVTSNMTRGLTNQHQALLKTINFMVSPDFFVYKDPIVSTAGYQAISTMLSSYKETIKQLEVTDKKEENEAAYKEKINEIVTSLTNSFHAKMSELNDMINTSYADFILPNDKSGNTKLEDLQKYIDDVIVSVESRHTASGSSSLPDKLANLKKSSRSYIKAVLEAAGTIEGETPVEGASTPTVALEMGSKLSEVISIASIIDRLKKYQNIEHLPLSVKQYVDDIMNPSSGAYTSESIDVLEKSLEFGAIGNAKTTLPGTFGQSFPTFKIYIIEEDANEYLMFNDFYSYASVQSIAIHEDRKSATKFATIKLTNVYGRLTDIISARLYTENPLTVRPDDEEDVSSFMLRPGAMIQIRMGYSGMLGPESIVFTGEIVSIGGEEVLEIVAQSWGAQLTQVIGTGSGTDISGGLIGAIFNNTEKDLGLVNSLLNLAPSGIHHLGGASPFLGNFAMRRTNMKEHARWWQARGLALLSGVVQALSGMNIEFVDTRMMNVWLRDPGGGIMGGIFGGKHRWLVYNESIWDSLSDMVLQYPNYKLVVREFDEEGTIVIGKQSDIYQYTYEYNMYNAIINPILWKIRSGITNPLVGLKLLQKWISEEKARYTNTSDMPIYNLTVNSINNFYNSYPFKRVFASVVSEFNKHEPIGDGIANVISGSTTRNLSVDIIFNSLSGLLSMAGENKDAAIRELNYLPPLDGRKEKKHNVAWLVAYILSHTIPIIMETILYEIGMTTPGFRPVGAVHIKTASKDIIRNNIKLEAGYNRVDLSYMYEDFIGFILGSFLGLDIFNKLLGTTGITVEGINDPSNRQHITISASPTLNPSVIRTYSTFQKNATIRSTLSTPREYIVANTILGNLANDYYGGEIVLAFDPNIRTYDKIMMYDDVNDMWGMIQVGAVTHMLSKEWGAVTIIKPDLYYESGIDINTQTLGNMAQLSNALRFFGVLAFFAISWLGGKVLTAGIKTLLNFGFAKKLTVKLATTKLNTLLASEDVFVSEVSKLAKSNSYTFTRVLKESLVEAVDNARKSGLNKAQRDVAKTLIKKIEELEKLISKDEGMSSYEVAERLGRIIFRDVKGAKDLFIKDGKPTKVIQSILKGTTGKSHFANVLKNMAVESLIGPYGGTQWFGKATWYGKGTGGMVSFRTWANWLSRWFRLGLGYRVFKAMFFDPTSMIQSIRVGLGEYFYMRNPITVAGLIKKGEPFISNLDGIKKAETLSGLAGLYQSLWEERVKFLFEPAKELLGNIELGMDEMTTSFFTEMASGVTNNPSISDILRSAFGIGKNVIRYSF